MSRIFRPIQRPFARLRRIQRRRRGAWIALASSALLWIAALAFLGWLDGRVLWLTLHRITNPIELEFQEGDHALAAIRVLEGKPLYPPPNGEYLPLLYSPLTHYISAGFMELTGQRNLFAGRLMGLTATFGCMLLLGLWTWRETKRLAPSLAAPMIFYACAPLTGWWFDLYRVDMPALLLTLGGGWLLLCRRGTERAEIGKGIFAGGLLVLAALAKQSSAVIAIGMVALAAPVSPLRAVWAASAGLTLGLLSLTGLMIEYHAFWFYCVTSISRMGYNLETWQHRIWMEFFLPALPLEIIAALLALLSVFRRQWRRALLFPLALGAIAVSLRGLLKLGGYVNHYLISWMFLALIAGIAMGRLRRMAPRFAKGFAILASPLLCLLIAGWLGEASGAAAWSRNPGGKFPVAVGEVDHLKDHLPLSPDLALKLIDAIRNCKGSVWVIHHNYYARLAGREPVISVDSVRDLTIGGEPVSPYALGLIDSGQFDYLLLDNQDIQADWLDTDIRREILDRYVLFARWNVPIGGMQPRALWIRQDLARR